MGTPTCSTAHHAARSTAKADEVVRALHGTTFQECELVVEPAKATRA